MDTPASRLERSGQRGITAIGVFFLCGALVAFLAGTTLVWRGTALDRIWALNPRAYNSIAPFGKAVGIPFSLLALTLGVAGVGCLERRIWGWRLGVAIVGMQILGDLMNVFLGRAVEGAMGLAIAGALLFYLLRRRTRAAFDHRGSLGS